MAAELAEIVGEVRKERWAPGSKSDREAYVLAIRGRKKYLLRSRGHSGFGADEKLDGLVGRRIRGRGVVSGVNMVLHEFDVVSE